jgi:hypothetical protein
MNGDLQTDFDRIVAAFSAIARIKSPLQRAFVLSRTAAYHNLPRAEFRRLYGIWERERLSNLVSFPSDGGQSNEPA